MGVPIYAEQVPWMVGDDAQGFFPSSRLWSMSFSLNHLHEQGL